MYGCSVLPSYGCTLFVDQLLGGYFLLLSGVYEADYPTELFIICQKTSRATLCVFVFG